MTQIQTTQYTDRDIYLLKFKHGLFKLANDTCPIQVQTQGFKRLGDFFLCVLGILDGNKDR